MAPRTHWLFGDQLGPHFLDPRRDGPDAHAPLLMIEARSVLRRRRFHRARPTSSSPRCATGRPNWATGSATSRPGPTRKELAEAGFGGGGGKAGRLTVCHPASRAALDFVTARDGIDVLPARGFCWHRRSSGRGRRSTGATGCGWRASTGGCAGSTICSWTARSRPAERGTSTTTTVSRRPGGPRPWTCPRLTVRTRTRSTTRCAATSTAGNGTARSRSWAATAPPLPRHPPGGAGRARRFVAHRLGDSGRYEDAMLAADPS